MEHIMDDYQETRLHEPDPPPEVRKVLKRRRMLSWVLYGATAAALLAVLLSSAFKLW
jgi:hypothetical protein